MRSGTRSLARHAVFLLTLGGAVAGLLADLAHSRPQNPAAFGMDTQGYIVPTTQFLATIFYAQGARQLLAVGDQVAIDAGANHQLQVGDRLAIVRQSSAIHHPVTKQAIGFLVTTIGYATAVSVQPTVTILQITRAITAIQPGDHVSKFTAPSQITPAALALKFVSGEFFVK